METNKTLSNVEIVSIKSAIDKIMMKESDSIVLRNLCERFTKLLESGKHDAELCNEFLLEFAKVSTDNTKDILSELNESISRNEKNIELAKSFYALDNTACRFVAPVLEGYLVSYMTNKNAETRNALLEQLSLFANEPVIRNIYDIAKFEAYDESNGKALVNAKLNESDEKDNAPRVYTEEEVEQIVENRIAGLSKAEPEKKTVGSIENHINLHGVISNILRENKSNEKLRVFCEQYINALNNGKSDEVLYESFISGISNWNYLSAVDTELSALKDRVANYKQDIDLKKILRIMEQCESYYIVPLIEDVVVDYVNDKSVANRIHLLRRLEAFEYDNFVRDIITVVNKDQSISNNVYLGESVETPNRYVHTEPVYSPVQMVNENECVFNVNGIYYKKSGSDISKLGKSDINGLSESFKTLCRLVNSNNVKVDGQLNTISVYSGSDSAVISESEIVVNGNKMTTGELEKLSETAVYMDNDDRGFFKAVLILNENFDNIAELNFVKRVVSNDNNGLSVDVFRVNESLYVTTTDSGLGVFTFYKNVNPIQCRNYINEHMGINVAPLFEDILPEQDNVEKNAADKKKEFEDYIESLEEKKSQLLSMKDESSDTEDIDDAIDLIDKEIEDTKNDYKKFQKDTEEFFKGSDKAEKSLDDETKDNKDDSDDSDDKDDDKETDVELDPDKESPEEMSEPIQKDSDDVDNLGIGAEDDTTGEPIDDLGSEDDEFGDVPSFDSDFDVPGRPTDDDSFKVVKVSYNRNVKTNVLSHEGEVFVLIPSVDANGDVHDETRKITFYLDGDRKPILNNDYIPLDMYKSIVDAIINCPDTESVEVPSEEPDDDPTKGGGIKAAVTEAPVTVTPAAEPAKAEVPSEPAKEEAPTEPAKEEPNKDGIQETPAETQEKDSEAQYPISLGVYPDEISPIDFDEFKDDLDKMKIEHSESEGVEKQLCLKIGNRAQAFALRKYMKDWMNFTDGDFNSYFPELVKCFTNKQSEFPVGPKNEGVEIKGVKPLFESKGDKFSVVIPSTKVYADMLGIDYRPSDTGFCLIAENEEDAQNIYNKLYEHNYNCGGNVEQDVKDILEHYAPKYGEKAERLVRYNVVVPFNNFLMSKMEAKGFNVTPNNDSMTITVTADKYGSAKKMFESYYGDAAPTEVRDFVNFLSEGVHITVKDDATGKTVEINTDDFNGTSSASEENESADFESSFKDTTFDYKDSMVFGDDEESDEDKDKKDEKDDEKHLNDSEDSEAEEKDKEKEGEEKETEDEKKDEESEDEEKEEKKEEKKKFKFKVKKAKNESLTANGTSLNESADPTILDFVDTPAGKGQIVFQTRDGYIVNVAGHTFPYEKKDIKMLRERPDTVSFPWKIDPVTLKTVFESYVDCGMFINNAQITPSDCKVKFNEFDAAEPDDEIELVIEGEKTKCMKKYVRITENLNEALDVANFIEGKLVEGANSTPVVFNKSDYMRYKNLRQENIPVRTIIKEGDSAKLCYVGGAFLRLNENDEYVPDYAEDLNKAISSTI